MIASPNRITGSACSSDSMKESSNPDYLPLTDVFASNCIESLASSISKAEAIRCLVKLLANHQCLDREHASTITRQIIQRESYGSSAIGNGLAFPHLRTNTVRAFVGAIGVAPEGIDFDALDQEPTRIVFLTLSPIDFREQQINLLSQLVRLVKDKAFRLQLNHLLTQQDIYRYLRDMDDHSGMISNSDRPAASGSNRHE